MTLGSENLEKENYSLNNAESHVFLDIWADFSTRRKDNRACQKSAKNRILLISNVRISTSFSRLSDMSRKTQPSFQKKIPKKVIQLSTSKNFNILGSICAN